jgi:hypothetical protein
VQCIVFDWLLGACQVEGGFGEAPQLLVLTSSIPVCKFFSCDIAEARSAAAAHRNLAAWLGQSGQASAATAAPSTLRSASNQQGASTGLPAPLGALLSTGGGEEATFYTGECALLRLVLLLLLSRGQHLRTAGCFAGVSTRVTALDASQGCAGE